MNSFNDQFNSVLENTQETLHLLGNISSFVHTKDKPVKGYLYGYLNGEKVHLDSLELRKIAADLLNIAQMLEIRASQEDSE